MNKVPGKIKISYALEEIFERPLNIPKRPSIENIGIHYKYWHTLQLRPWCQGHERSPPP